jgi:protein ImuA
MSFSHLIRHDFPEGMPQTASLAALRDRIRRIEQPARHGVLPFGIAAIDDALPGGGLALGAVHEILGSGGDEEDGAAAAGFAAAILARIGAGPTPTSPSHRCAMGPSLSPPKGGEGKPGRRLISLSAPGGGEGRGEVGDSRALGAGPVLWCLRRPDLYGPGLMAHGLDPARLVLAAAPRDDEILWAIEEGLRMPGLAAVIGEIGRLPMVASRRLQLAAERSGVTAFLLRRWRNGGEAAAERERPSAALTRWRIASLPSRPPSTPSPARGGGLGWGLGQPRWRVELLRCRGGVPAQWEVEVADATGHVCLSAALADRPAAAIRQETHRFDAEPGRRHAG